MLYRLFIFFTVSAMLLGFFSVLHDIHQKKGSKCEKFNPRKVSCVVQELHKYNKMRERNEFRLKTF